MKTQLLIRLSAGAAALAITGAFASSLPAQNDDRFLATACGRGVIEMCGETEVHTCGWKWRWLPITMFPIIGMYPTYECTLDERISLYKDRKKADGEFGPDPIAHEM